MRGPGLPQVVLCIENCASMLARRYAVGVLHLAFSKSSVLCVNELLKLLVSVGFVAAHPAHHGRLRAHMRAVVVQSAPMFVPAVVYLVVNLISYPALERINASVFTAISQLKVCHLPASLLPPGPSSQTQPRSAL